MSDRKTWFITGTGLVGFEFCTAYAAPSITVFRDLSTSLAHADANERVA
jgi:hypothetical protein